jgi:hypothetical protein
VHHIAFCLSLYFLTVFPLSVFPSVCFESLCFNSAFKRRMHDMGAKKQLPRRWLRVKRLFVQRIGFRRTRTQRSGTQ